MSIALKICQSQSDDCKTIVLTDKTGAYSLSNLTGWGAPNSLLSTALTATITISKRDATGLFIDSPLSPIDVFPTFPSDVNATFNLTAELAGYGAGALFSDGIYKITYTVTGVDGSAYTLETIRYDGLLCNGMCCFKKKADKVSTCICDCEDIEKSFIKLWTYIRLYEAARDCANFNQMQKYIDKIFKTCVDCGCGCD
jgi:hypothetical protein